MPSFIEAQTESVFIDLTLVASIKTKLRHFICSVSGGHELYRAHSKNRIYQKCLCGFETSGWIIESKVHLKKKV